MKKLGIGLGILIVILMGAVLVVPGFLNWNEYKTQIQQTASEYSGRDVKIMGDISLSLLPTSALSVKEVSVANLDGGRAEYMLSLKSLDVKVSFPSVISSLFGGKIKVEKFILVDPVVALEILPDGRGNWQFGGAEKADMKGPASSADISFDKFQIVNGQVSFEDLATEQKELLRKINANVKVSSINGPFEVSGGAKYQGLDAKLDLKLGKNRTGKKVPLSLSLAMQDSRIKADVIGGVILKGKDSSFSGQVDMTASDAGDFFAAASRLKNQKSPSSFRIGQDFALNTALDVTPRKISVKDLNIRMGQSRGQGAAEITMGEKLNILSSLSVNKLDMDPLLELMGQQKTPQAAKPATGESGVPDLWRKEIIARLSGKMDFKLGALKYNEKIASQIVVKTEARNNIIAIKTLRARMPGGSSLDFTGQVAGANEQAALTGDLALNSSNLRGLLSWLKADVSDIPSGRLAQFSFKSKVKVTEELAQVYGIEGILDAMRFSGGLSYAIQDRPSYGVQLDVRNLNLDSYRAAREDASGGAGLKSVLASLDRFDATYKLAARNLTVNGLNIAAARMEGVLLAGRLEASIIKLDDFSGVNLTASGRGGNFSAKPEITLKISADSTNLAPLQRALKWNDQVDLRKLGKVSLAGEVSAGLEKMEVNLKSEIGASSLQVIGNIRSATMKQFPEFGSADLEVNGAAKSLAGLIDQLGLSLSRPMPGDDHPVQVNGRIKGNAALVDLDARIRVASSNITLKGRKKGKGPEASLDLALEMKGAETREFIRGLGIDFKPSREKLGPIALKMMVTGAGDQYALNNIVGDVGTVKLSGSGKLNIAPRKPYFDFKLKAGAIPLQDFMEKKAGAAAGGALKASEKFGQWTKAPMDLSLLSAYEGRAQVSAASLHYNGYVFENPTFETVLKDGILTVNNFTGRLFGGEVSMSGQFGGAKVPQLEMKMSLKQASLSQATKSSAGIAPISGLFDMSASFASVGVSQYDIMSALSGNGKIVASPGLIHGVDIPALSTQLSKMNSNNALLSLLNTTLSGGETAYKGGESNIVAKDGMINFSPFDVELEGAKSNMTLALNLTQWDIRSQGRLSLNKHPDAPPIEVSVTGNVSNPKVNFKTDRLEKYVGAKIASSMLQQMIGGEGGLEGIFGGQQKPAKKAPDQDSAAAPTAVPVDKTKTEVEKAKPAEEFGKRLLQKLFEKEKKADPDNNGQKPDSPGQ